MAAETKEVYEEVSQERDMRPFAKIRFHERFAFAIGDFGFNFVYGAVSTIYAFFLTNYVGISPAYAGMIILISRVFDGISDIICGLLTKKFNTRWGRMRPWLLFLSGPLMISFVLMFVVPASLTVFWKCMYIFIVYNLCNTIFGTGINLPYGALGNLISQDQRERTILQTFRMVIAPMGALLSTAFTLPLVIRLGNDERAWIIVVCIWAVIGFLTLFWCFADTRERVVPDEGEGEHTISAWQSLKLVVTNYYWWVGLGMWGIMNYVYASAGTTAAYYAANIIENTDYLMYMQIAERVSLVIFIAMCPFIIGKIGGKKYIVITGAIVVILGQLMMLFAGDNPTFLVINSLTRGIGIAGIQGCVFVIISDAAEYAAWRDGVRQDGMVYSAASIGAKIGPGVAGGVIGLIMSGYGYDGMAASQTAEALEGIRIAFIWPPIVVCILVILLMIPYKLDKIYPQIERDIKEREMKKNRVQA